MPKPNDLPGGMDATGIGDLESVIQLWLRQLPVSIRDSFL
jgi:hypothetical protein